VASVAVLCVAITAAVFALRSSDVEATAAAAADPPVTGEWEPLITTWPIQTVHSTMLPNSKVLFWPAWDVGSNVHVWDPGAGTIATGPMPNFDPFCAGHVVMPDGRVFVTGGHLTGQSRTIGLDQASYYDPTSNTWTALPVMANKRWYPTNTVLANGDVLVTSGLIDTIAGTNKQPEVWQTASNSWRQLTGAVRQTSLYPFMFVAPNGQVFHAGAEQATSYLNPSGSGAWTAVANRVYGDRTYGSAVMYDVGKVLVLGGGDPPTRTAEVIDLNSPTPTWRAVAPMAFARRQPNATILPDGKVFVSGGHNGTGNDDSSHPVYPTEMWDPATETFTLMDSLTTYRGYHSVAHLLPDGKVFSAGGEPIVTTAELYNPPYLFKGAQPTISAAPANVNYNQQFVVETPNAASITKVTWVRLSAVTHAFNENQRFNQLNFTIGSGSLTVTSPASGSLAPPGDYMLFILNGNGVPSEARFVRLIGSGGAPPPPPPPPPTPAPPSGLTATNVPCSTNCLWVRLAWVDNSNNETKFELNRSTDQVNWECCWTQPTNGTAFTNTQLRSNTVYYYRVRAINADGASSWSATATVRTP
jgi:galactose oxidase